MAAMRRLKYQKAKRFRKVKARTRQCYTLSVNGNLVFHPSPDHPGTPRSPPSRSPAFYPIRRAYSSSVTSCATARQSASKPGKFQPLENSQHCLGFTA
jgi:hypothetical protein